MCSVPIAWIESTKRKRLIFDESDYDEICNSRPGIIVGQERWAEPECYPCVMIEVTISGITRFDFVYRKDFGMKQDEPWTTTTGDGLPSTTSGCGYSVEEKRKIKEMRDNGTLRDTCPKCGHFWFRDYPTPVRQCPACGEKKPWADE